MALFMVKVSKFYTVKWIKLYYWIIANYAPQRFDSSFSKLHNTMQIASPKHKVVTRYLRKNSYHDLRTLPKKIFNFIKLKSIFNLRHLSLTYFCHKNNSMSKIRQKYLLGKNIIFCLTTIFVRAIEILKVREWARGGQYSGSRSASTQRPMDLLLPRLYWPFLNHPLQYLFLHTSIFKIN